MSNLNKVLSLIKFAVGLMYVALGFFLTLYPERFHNLIEETQLVRIFGGLLIFYGGFRIYRAYKTQSNY